MVRYGFCRDDKNGEIVSVWNWGDLDTVLRDIGSDGEEDEDEDFAIEAASLKVVNVCSWLGLCSERPCRDRRHVAPCPVCVVSPFHAGTSRALDFESEQLSGAKVLSEHMRFSQGCEMAGLE